ncbi:MAG: thiaminase II [Pseudomonadota bacterium]
MTFFDDLKAGAAEPWRAYTEHRFTDAMADASLPEAAFKTYLVQDYLFLIEFARAYALAAYKAPSLADMRDAVASISAIVDVEMNLHLGLCEKWGLSPAEIEAAPAAPETLAYTRYVLETGMRGDLLALKVALSPCVIGYAEIATRLSAVPGALDDANPYAVWISEYTGDEYRAVAAAAVSQLDTLAERYATPARRDELQRIFAEASRLEADFWEMGYRAIPAT